MTALLEPQSAPVVDVAPAAAPPEPVTHTELVTRPAPAAQAAPVRPPAAARVRQVLSPRGVRLFGAVMIALYALGVGVQPAPDGPQPVAPWWADVLNTVVFFGLLTVFAGAIAGRRWSLWTGLVTGGSLLTLSATCPLEGHHEIAAWWFVQMAVGVAMTALPAALLRRTQAASKAG